jgi:hypothetical protein
MSTYVRLYLVPAVANANQQVIDVLSTDLVLSNGVFTPVQTAQSVTLTDQPSDTEFVPFNQAQIETALQGATTREVRVCWREPVDSDDNPSDAIILEPDPSNGVCVCGITCSGTDLSFVVVQDATVPV